MSKYFLVLNPSSQSFRARNYWPTLFEALKLRKVEYDFAMTRGDGDAMRLSRQAARDGFDVVVAVGGDGTINEVINGLFEPESRVGKTSFGVVYTGTSPDFCGYHKIPLDTESAVDLLVSGKHRRVDVCRIIHRHPTDESTVSRIFTCCANFGLGAAVARGANSGLRKTWGDGLGTLLSIFSSLAAYKPPDVRVKLDGQEAVFPGLFNLFVGKSPLVASGIKFNLEIEPDDGKLYSLPLYGISLFRLFTLLPSIYTGTITQTFKPEFIQKIEILDAGAANEVEYDGDPRGRLPASIEVLPGGLDLVRA
ncbi:MAG: diacylglycerol kinase family lipid kinase [Candidatus Riflebacteria bacterium]|nr:diacylglycerol kinase family lipid kinase [Candidatus Riflebacteria bacterium]